MRKELALALAALAIGASARLAGAAPDAAPRFEWTAPPECIGRADLARAVEAELGRAAFSPSAESELVVRGRVVRDAGGAYLVTVSLDRATGETVGRRNLASDNHDCRSLDEAIGVLLTILLDVSRREIAAPTPSPWSFHAAAGGFATLGFLPGPGVEVAASVGPTLRGVIGFALELGVDLGPSGEVDEGSVTARAAVARLGVTPILSDGSPELALHFAAGAGLMQARASGFFEDEEATRALVEARAGLRLSFPISEPLWFEISGDFGLMPLRPRFVVRNADGSEDELFRPFPVFGALGPSLSLRL